MAGARCWFDRMNICNRPAIETTEPMTLPGKVISCPIKIIMNGKSSAACARHVRFSLLLVVAEFHPSLEVWCPSAGVLSRNTATRYITVKWRTLQANLVTSIHSHQTQCRTMCPQGGALVGNLDDTYCRSSSADPVSSMHTLIF